MAAPLSLDELFGADTLGSIAADPFLLRILATAPVRDIAFERMLTSLRRALLDQAETRRSTLPARSRASASSTNMYSRARRKKTRASAELKTEIERALTAGAEIAPTRLASLAMYAPLHALATAQALSERGWPAPLDGVVTQQLREPRAEQDLRASMPRLTEIEDAVSLRVRAQYEANPYPRWTRAAGAIQPTGIDRFLREQFPTAAFTPLHNEAPDILVAGCGTGWQTTGIAQQFATAQITAVDLSVAQPDLCQAQHAACACPHDRLRASRHSETRRDRAPTSTSFTPAACCITWPIRAQAWRVLLCLLANPAA